MNIMKTPILGNIYERDNLSRKVVAFHSKSTANGLEADQVEWCRPSQEGWKTSFVSLTNWNKWASAASLKEKI